MAEDQLVEPEPDPVAGAVVGSVAWLMTVSSQSHGTEEHMVAVYL